MAADQVEFGNKDRFNITHPSNTMLSIVSGTLGAVGIPGNLLLMSFILSEYKKRKPHEWLLFVLALGDFLFCLNNVVLEAPFILRFDNAACKVAGAIDYGLGLVTFFTPPVVAYNRYLAIYYSQRCTKIFTTQNVFLIWICLFVFSFVCITPFAAFDALGQDDLGLCGTRVVNGPLAGVQIFMEAIGIASTVMLVFFSYKVIKKIYNHKKQVGALTQAQSHVIEESRELIIVIVIIAAVPMLTQVPAALVKLIQSFTPPMEIWFTRIVIAAFPLTPACNPYITMYVVKEYRKMVKHCFRKTNVTPAPVSRFIVSSDMTPAAIGLGEREGTGQGIGQARHHRNDWS